MLRKRYTVEVVIELPASGNSSKLEDYLRVGTNSLVTKKSFKILKEEEFDELLPHEQRRGEKKAIRETILALFKKHELPLNLSTNQDWGDDINLWIHSKKSARDAFFKTTGHATCSSSYEKARNCKTCKLTVFDSCRFDIDKGTIIHRTWEHNANKQAHEVVGSISDPEMTQFMEFLNKRYAWCKK